MEKMEKIINKIKNLFDLANNNPNENEALAAALKAQELMAKYNIQLEQVEGKSAESRAIVTEVYKQTDKHEMKNWKYGLADIIAKNFRCKTFCYGSDIAFYGYKEDAKIALQVFTYLYEVGNKLAVKYYNNCKKNGLPTRGAMNTYLMGFRAGIKSVLEKQCTALMIVVPEEVSKKYDVIVADARKVTHRLNNNGDNHAYDTGKRDGRDAAQARSLEEKSA